MNILDTFGVTPPPPRATISQPQKPHFVLTVTAHENSHEHENLCRDVAAFLMERGFVVSIDLAGDYTNAKKTDQQADVNTQGKSWVHVERSCERA